MKLLAMILVVLAFFKTINVVFAEVTPNASDTPGVLCTPSDPDFEKYDYPEHIARCLRNVSHDEKIAIAKKYGDIPENQWINYEFDHLIPLCAGGSDNPANLWPQPIAEAHKKDILENDVCLAMKAGTLTQAQAVQKIHDWFNSVALSYHLVATYSSEISCFSEDKKTSVHYLLMGKDQISNISIRLIDQDGEHEAINVKKMLQGQAVDRAKSTLLKNYMRYKLNEKGDDKFELFLPDHFLDEKATFNAYLKIGFEDNFPSLKKLECR